MGASDGVTLSKLRRVEGIPQLLISISWLPSSDSFSLSPLHYYRGSVCITAPRRIIFVQEPVPLSPLSEGDVRLLFRNSSRLESPISSPPGGVNLAPAVPRMPKLWWTRTVQDQHRDFLPTP